ncbi:MULTISPECIES: hypothetical protein [unclassified Fusobacterium]|uniref:hypothetical protein n=1 Tax=unclassified Fusobacterium TaxID=2648384 RepID=UPI001B8D28BF|nr:MULTISPECIES: hypothetical protein [unclassified Fusobacterium]MBR8702214.1 hypothetical protein [Fusobacterium sp. DD45]MBR8712031.1 hypothetical protein [Fusobacterium sp. DD28]MBR8752607.1 hypothetical protein [Fusobacterium sp. DD26]
MSTATVRTKEELERAKNNGVEEIIVVGELAQKLKTAKVVGTFSKATVFALVAALAAVPATGGLSMVALVPIAAMTGVEIAVITAVVFVGMSLLLAILKEYDIRVTVDKDGNVVVILEKK